MPYVCIFCLLKTNASIFHCPSGNNIWLKDSKSIYFMLKLSVKALYYSSKYKECNYLAFINVIINYNAVRYKVLQGLT